jgi:hypothetical protein
MALLVKDAVEDSVRSEDALFQSLMLATGKEDLSKALSTALLQSHKALSVPKLSSFNLLDEIDNQLIEIQDYKGASLQIGFTYTKQAVKKKASAVSIANAELSKMVDGFINAQDNLNSAIRKAVDARKLYACQTAY